jgi:hypothetical protein
MLSIQLFPKTPQDGILWEDFKRDMRAAVYRADQYLVEYDASVLAQQEFESQQEQLLAKTGASTIGRDGLLKTYEIQRDNFPDIHSSFPQMAQVVADHAQNMAALVKLSERFSLADPLYLSKESPETRSAPVIKQADPDGGSSSAPTAEPPPSVACASGEDFATADDLLGETEARRALLVSKLQRTRKTVLGKIAAMVEVLRDGDSTPRGGGGGGPAGQDTAAPALPILPPSCEAPPPGQPRGGSVGGGVVGVGSPGGGGVVGEETAADGVGAALSAAANTRRQVDSGPNPDYSTGLLELT